MRCSASTPLSLACWLCILPSRPRSAFDWDGTAKVSALTSGADPRSAGPTTLSSPVTPPCQHEERALCYWAAGQTRPYPDAIGWLRRPRSAGRPGRAEERGVTTVDQAKKAGSQGLLPFPGKIAVWSSVRHQLTITMISVNYGAVLEASCVWRIAWA